MATHVICPVCHNPIWSLSAEGEEKYDGKPCGICIEQGAIDVWNHGAKTHDANDKWWDVSEGEHLRKADKHINSWIENPIDDDSGLPHIDHAISRLQMAKHCKKVKSYYE